MAFFVKNIFKLPFIDYDFFSGNVNRSGDKSFFRNMFRKVEMILTRYYTLYTLDYLIFIDHVGSYQ